MPKLHSDSDNLYRVLQTTAGRKIICFIRVSENEALGVCATDGCDMWKLNLEMSSPLLVPESHQAASVSTCVSTFTPFRTTFLKGDMTITEVGDKLNLTLEGQGLAKFELELPEAKAAEKKKDLQAILFHLTDKVDAVEKDLKVAEKKIDNLEQQQMGDANTGKNVFDMTANVKRKKAQTKAPPKAPGMSVINPGSKKRVAPKGVQFD